MAQQKSNAKANMDLSYDRIIRDSIKKIALHGIVNPKNNVVHGTGKSFGYVTEIHTEGDLAGTVDVQEFYAGGANDDDKFEAGLHEGVLLSAIQNNNGMVIIPKKYSEVVVTKDCESGKEYITMYSHVDVINLDSHDTVSIGVKEREKFDEEDEEGDDINDLKETGLSSNTTYHKDSVITTVQDTNTGDSARQIIESSKISQMIGNDVTSRTIDKDGIIDKHGEASINLNKDASSMSMGSSTVKVENGTVYLGSDKETDYAVLGIELANVLSKMLGYISKITTPTMMGPQTPVNVAAFLQLKADVEKCKADASGFLTNKVQIQK